MPDGLIFHLAAPKTVAMQGTSPFSWLGSPQLTERCHYRLKLWRSDGARIALSAAAANHVTMTPGGYEAAVDMTKDFPPGQQFGGGFVWTVELVESVHSNGPLLIHVKPQAFTWVPQ